MMVGIPTSGKSTFIKTILDFPICKSAIVLSTDNYIDDVANSFNLTHDEVFAKYIKSATKQLNENLEKAIKNNQNIIHDQTNLTKKSRAKKLTRIPLVYKKIAVYTEITLEEALKRNKNRQGKVIPENTLTQMFENCELPTSEEGFDLIMKLAK